MQNIIQLKIDIIDEIKKYPQNQQIVNNLIKYHTSDISIYKMLELHHINKTTPNKKLIKLYIDARLSFQQNLLLSCETIKINSNLKKLLDNLSNEEYSFMIKIDNLARYYFNRLGKLVNTLVVLHESGVNICNSIINNWINELTKYMPFGNHKIKYTIRNCQYIIDNNNYNYPYILNFLIKEKVHFSNINKIENLFNISILPVTNTEEIIYSIENKLGIKIILLRIANINKWIDYNDITNKDFVYLTDELYKSQFFNNINERSGFNYTSSNITNINDIEKIKRHGYDKLIEGINKNNDDIKCILRKHKDIVPLNETKLFISNNSYNQYSLVYQISEDKYLLVMNNNGKYIFNNFEDIPNIRDIIKYTHTSLNIKPDVDTFNNNKYILVHDYYANKIKEIKQDYPTTNLHRNINQIISEYNMNINNIGLTNYLISNIILDSPLIDGYDKNVDISEPTALGNILELKNKIQNKFIIDKLISLRLSALHHYKSKLNTSVDYVKINDIINVINNTLNNLEYKL